MRNLVAAATMFAGVLLGGGAAGGGLLIDQLESRPNVAANVIAALREGNEPIDLVLSIRGREGPLPFYRPGIDDPPERRAQVLDQVLEFGRNQAQPGTGILVERQRFPSAGNAFITADAHAIARLASHPLVSGLAIATRPRPLAEESVQLTQFPPLHALGYTGSGIKVAIIDSRFDPAVLGGAVAEQHCFCRLKGGAGCCPGQVDELHDITGTALPPVSQPIISDSNGDHGTNVARMIAGAGFSSAPHVALVVIAAPDGEDSLRAVQWLATRPDIRVLNMSFGVDPYAPGVCDAHPLAAPWSNAISLLHANGMISLAGSGNAGNYLGPAMGSPACLSQTVAVTGSWRCNYDGLATCPDTDAQVDKIWLDVLGAKPGQSYLYGADSSSATDLAAPAAPMFGLASPTPSIAGTSYAAPLAAGCAALLDQALPGAGNETLRMALRESPSTATRPGHGVFPRLDCAHAKQVLQSSQGINLNQRGITGNWYNPLTSGQGLSIEVFEDAVAPGHGTLAAGWFTFDSADCGGPPCGPEKQRWYVLQGSVYDNDSSAELLIGTVVGGSFNTGDLGADEVGTARIQFGNCNEGSLEFEFDDGRYGVIPLTRLLANVNCTAGGGGAPGHPDYQLSGNWYRGTGFGGQGLIIEVNPVNPFVFGTWYTFVPATDTTSSGVARQRWFSFGSYSPVNYTPGQHSIIQMPLVETTRGRFNMAEPEVAQRQVGVATLTFADCTEASLDFEFTLGEMDGIQGEIDLQRVGGVVPPVCNF